MYIYIAWLFIFGSKKYLLLVLGINFFRDNLYKLVIYLILCLPKIKTNENLMNIMCVMCVNRFVLLVIGNREQTSLWKIDHYCFTVK